MIVTLALAAALQADVYYDDAGCKWKRRPVIQKVARKAAASGVPYPKKPSKPRPAKAKPVEPDDEFIGCDPEGFGVWRSDIESVESIFELVPPVAISRIEPVPSEAAPPVTFAEACDCESGYPVFVGYPVFLGGGGGVFVPGRPVTPIPEPETWLLFALGGVAAWLRDLVRRRA